MDLLIMSIRAFAMNGEARSGLREDGAKKKGSLRTLSLPWHCCSSCIQAQQAATRMARDRLLAIGVRGTHRSTETIGWA
ncbi:MAG: hypothetical protein H6R26_126 [Proteobacteria bacterium]|nr:hypothetical protein [Pseudomonadota bacterium]